MLKDLLGKLTADEPESEPTPPRPSAGTGMFDLLEAAGDTRALMTRLLRLGEADAATLAAELDRHPDEVALVLEQLVARGEATKRQHDGQWLYRMIVAQRSVRRVRPDIWSALDDET